MAGRPLLLGFDAAHIGGKVGHMTVCVGYEFVGATVYVYVSDAFISEYARHELIISDTGNDFICKMRIVKTEE